MAGLNYYGLDQVCGRVTVTAARSDWAHISHLLSLLRREDELRPVADDEGGCVLWSLEVEHCTQLSVILFSLSLSLI